MPLAVHQDLVAPPSAAPGESGLAFTDAVMAHLGDDVLEAMAPEHVRALRGALRANAPLSRHPVDARGVIPLFFFRLYFVFGMGRDRRGKTRLIETRRRQRASAAATTTLLTVMMSAACWAIFMGLYVVKSLLGIDLIEGFHLTTWFS